MSFAGAAGCGVDIRYILDLRDFPDSPFAHLVTHDFLDVLADGGVDTVMEMMGGFTLLRLTSLVGMMNVSFTKEELLALNAKLNKIKKPKIKQ